MPKTHTTFEAILCDDQRAVTEPPRPADVPDAWEFMPADGIQAAAWVGPARAEATACR